MTWPLVGATAVLLGSILDLIFVVTIAVYGLSLIFYGLGGDALLSRPIEQQLALCVGATAIRVARLKP